MSPISPFEDHLTAWLERGPTEAPASLLGDIVRAVPSVHQRRAGLRFPWARMPILRVARAAAGVAVVVAIAGAGVLVLANRPGTPGTLPIPASTPTAVPPSDQAGIAVASATPTAPATEPPSGPVASATPKAPATTEPPRGPVACGPATVRAQVGAWQGAMGQRIATVDLANISAAPCTIRARSRPQLVDGRGTILIDSAAAASSATLTVGPGGTLRTMVEDSNYCGPTPKAPVTVAFVLGANDRVVASPVPPGDATVPPCNGAAVAASIQMHPWAP
jgi:Protein of unknown function (DUF4232)